VRVISPAYLLPTGDVPLSLSLETSLNASNSPAGTVIFSKPTISASTVDRHVDAFILNNQSFT